MDLAEHFKAGYNLQLFYWLSIHAAQCGSQGNWWSSVNPAERVGKDYRSQMAFSPIVAAKLILTASHRR